MSFSYNNPLNTPSTVVISLLETCEIPIEDVKLILIGKIYKRGEDIKIKDKKIFIKLSYCANLENLKIKLGELSQFLNIYKEESNLNSKENDRLRELVSKYKIVTKVTTKEQSREDRVKPY